MLIFLESEMTNLIVPDGVEYLQASNMGLTNLYLSDSIDIVYCMSNSLTQLELPVDVGIVYASTNRIRKLTTRDNKRLTRLGYLDISENSKLERIDIEPPLAKSLITIDMDRHVEINDSLVKELEIAEKEYRH
jgi:hypothetical protein